MSTKFPAIPGVWVNSKRCPFGSSVFDSVLSLDDRQGATNCQHFDRTAVFVEQAQGGLHLHSSSHKSDGAKHVPFGRARECLSLGSTKCPTTVPSTQKATFRQPTPPRKQFVQLAVVGLVFSKHNELLITRRPSYMRSFPGAWVFPGGSVDAEDSCLETAISREIREETGIDATDWTVQSVWESVFPTIPKLNVPIKRHHLVIYLSTRLEETARPSLSLCDEEVDGAVWLSEDNLDGILSKSLSLPNDADQNQDSSIDVLLGPNASSIQKESLHHLAGIYPQFDEIQTQSASVNFGIAQGSLFALEEYWKHNKR